MYLISKSDSGDGSKGDSRTPPAIPSDAGDAGGNDPMHTDSDDEHGEKPIDDAEPDQSAPSVPPVPSVQAIHAAPVRKSPRK